VSSILFYLSSQSSGKSGLVPQALCPAGNHAAGRLHQQSSVLHDKDDRLRVFQVTSAKPRDGFRKQIAKLKSETAAFLGTSALSLEVLNS
jgi:hypothetical protein